MIKIVNKVVYDNGCYKGDIEIAGVIVNEGKTFFPAHWTPQQVLRKTIEALQKSIKIEIEGKWLKPTGITQEDILIKVPITHSGKIHTIIPKEE